MAENRDDEARDEIAGVMPISRETLISVAREVAKEHPEELRIGALADVMREQAVIFGEAFGLRVESMTVCMTFTGVKTPAASFAWSHELAEAKARGEITDENMPAVIANVLANALTDIVRDRFGVKVQISLPPVVRRAASFARGRSASGRARPVTAIARQRRRPTR